MAIDKEMEPILIAFVKHNKLHFSVNTFKEILSTIGSLPVAVVSICPSDGEEKDIVFNGCLKYLETLDIGDKVNKERIWKSKSSTDAKGIYLFPEPIIMRKSCDEVAVVLMELKGDFDPKTATREDLMILALSCVLSSTLIYNSGDHFSDEIQEFLQLFAQFGRGGVGPEMSDSYLNLALIINNWKFLKYPFGYHDSGTCPPNGKKILNYRIDRLDFRLSEDKPLEEKEANRNKFFINNFDKICFSLMPGKDSEMIDPEMPIPKFSDIWHKTVLRLFHPSHLAIKHLGHHKLNGHQLVQLFEQISSLMSEADTQSQTEDQFKNQMKYLTKEMAEEADHNNKIELKPSGLQTQISQLFGFDLDGLTNAVQSVINTI